MNKTLIDHIVAALHFFGPMDARQVQTKLRLIGVDRELIEIANAMNEEAKKWSPTVHRADDKSNPNPTLVSQIYKI